MGQGLEVWKNQQIWRDRRITSWARMRSRIRQKQKPVGWIEFWGALAQKVPNSWGSNLRPQCCKLKMLLEQNIRCVAQHTCCKLPFSCEPPSGSAQK